MKKKREKKNILEREVKDWWKKKEHLWKINILNKKKNYKGKRREREREKSENESSIENMKGERKKRKWEERNEEREENGKRKDKIQ